MSRSLVQHVYHLSLAGVVQGLRRRWTTSDTALAWHRATAGPLRGHELYVRPQGARLMMLEGTFDAPIYEALPPLLKLEGADCWDVGANIGYHSLTLSALGARVTAFEPVPANRERIRLHLERNPTLAQRIRLCDLALSDQDGTCRFTLSDNVDSGESSGSHLASATRPLPDAVYKSYQAIEITTRRLDTLLASAEFAPPKFIKLDVEGAEALVLKGAAECLRTVRPIWVIEVHHIHLMLEVTLILDAHNYDLRILAPETSSPSRCLLLATPRS